MNHTKKHFNEIHKKVKSPTANNITHFTLYEPKCRPVIQFRNTLIYTWQMKATGTPPDDIQAAVIQTLSACVTKCVESHDCFPLHGWVRLHQLPNPFPSRLFSSQNATLPVQGGKQLLASPAGLQCIAMEQTGRSISVIRLYTVLNKKVYDW